MARAGWYFRATLGCDPLTGKRSQATNAASARQRRPTGARKDLSGDRRVPRPSAVGMTVNELLDLYLDAGYARPEAADPWVAV
jgi:hypothetical protein